MSNTSNAAQKLNDLKNVYNHWQEQMNSPDTSETAKNMYKNLLKYTYEQIQTLSNLVSGQASFDTLYNSNDPSVVSLAESLSITQEKVNESIETMIDGYNDLTNRQQTGIEMIDTIEKNNSNNPEFSNIEIENAKHILEHPIASFSAGLINSIKTMIKDYQDAKNTMIASGETYNNYLQQASNAAAGLANNTYASIFVPIKTVTVDTVSDIYEKVANNFRNTVSDFNNFVTNTKDKWHSFTDKVHNAVTTIFARTENTLNNTLDDIQQSAKDIYISAQTKIDAAINDLQESATEMATNIKINSLEFTANTIEKTANALDKISTRIENRKDKYEKVAIDLHEAQEDLKKQLNSFTSIEPYKKEVFDPQKACPEIMKDIKTLTELLPQKPLVAHLLKEKITQIDDLRKDFDSQQNEIAQAYDRPIEASIRRTTYNLKNVSDALVKAEDKVAKAVSKIDKLGIVKESILNKANSIRNIISGANQDANQDANQEKDDIGMEM